jgi:NitT/TauT family transport system permease protein
MAFIYRFGAVKTIKLVYIPSVLSPYAASLATAVGLAWKSGIAAEVLCLPRLAIGTNLYYSKIYLETPSLFAWTIVVIVLSFMLEGLFSRLLRKRRKKRW